MEEGRYGLYNHRSFDWNSLRNEEEFQEEDVWGIVKEEKREFATETVSSKPTYHIASRTLPNAARMIPRANQSSNSQEPKMAQQSAPVRIPDWSKIYGGKKSGEGSRTSSWHDHDDDGHGVMDGSWDSDEEDDDGSNGSYMMPPHEYIARKHARGQTPSFSVCEGAGRTLKGRDLSRVRNAVLTRTGFLE